MVWSLSLQKRGEALRPAEPLNSVTLSLDSGLQSGPASRGALTYLGEAERARACWNTLCLSSAWFLHSEQRMSLSRPLLRLRKLMRHAAKFPSTMFEMPALSSCVRKSACGEFRRKSSHFWTSSAQISTKLSVPIWSYEKTVSWISIKGALLFKITKLELCTEMVLMLV